MCKNGVRAGSAYFLSSLLTFYFFSCIIFIMSILYNIMHAYEGEKCPTLRLN